MSEQIPKRRTSAIVWPIGLFLFVILYFASYGPYWQLVVRGKISNAAHVRMIYTVYLPVAYVVLKFHDHPVAQAYIRYVQWWE